MVFIFCTCSVKCGFSLDCHRDPRVAESSRSRSHVWCRKGSKPEVLQRIKSGTAVSWASCLSRQANTIVELGAPLSTETSSSGLLPRINEKRCERLCRKYPDDVEENLQQCNMRLPPLIRFAAVLPSETVHILDADRQFQKSFAVQGWGIVAVSEPSVVSDVSAVAGHPAIAQLTATCTLHLAFC